MTNRTGPVHVRPLQAVDAPECDAVIASLPDFFALESGITECAAAVRSQSGVVAVDDGLVAGFATWVHHRPDTAEITWAAVHTDRRRQGIGRRLITHLELDATATGVRWMSVLTLSPNDREGASYEPTRAFWAAIGYAELRDLDIWDEDLAVLCVKQLATG